MKKILTTGLSENAQIQFEDKIKLAMHEVKVIHTENPAKVFNIIPHESPDAVVLQVIVEFSDISDIINQLKRNSETQSIPVIVLFDEENINPDFFESFQNADFFLSMPLKQWEMISAFRTLFRSRQISDKEIEIQKMVKNGEDQYRKIIDGAPEPIFIQADMKFVYLNKSACRLFGIENASELIGEPVMDRFHADFHQTIKDRIYQVNVERKTVTNLFKQKFIRVDGSEVWVETMGEPVVFEGKNGVVVFVHEITSRMKAEQKLKESEERWQFALEGSGQGVWDWDLKTNKLFFSRHWKSMLGFNPDEIKNEFSEWESRVHPDDLSNAYADIQKHLNGETPFYRNEHRLLCKDGNYRWILDLGKIISYDEEGKPARFIGTHTDITAIKLTEKALKDSENRFRSTLDSMLEGCQIIGLNWDYLYLNEAAVLQSHLNRDDLTGKNFLKMWPGIENTELFKKMKHCMEERASVHMENLFTYPDGKTGWFELSIQPVPEGIFILSIDITERKTMEQKLKESEERYRLILDNSLDAVFLTSPDGSVYSANKAACNMFGMNEEEICRAGRNGLIDLEDPNLPKLLAERERTGKAKGELRFKRKDGSIFPAEISAALYYNSRGMQRNSMVIRDISERKQAENLLRELKENLEVEVTLKTKELRERITELERFHEATIEREFRIKELLTEIERLKK